MIRVIVESVLLFLLPTLLYVAYIVILRNMPREQGKNEMPEYSLEEAPLLWLFVAGAALAVATLILFSSTSGGKPGQSYEPPALKDGRIEPGHLR